MSRFIIRFRWLIISVCLITGCFFIFLIPKASTEPDIRNYIPSNLQSKIRTDSIESVFGFQDMVMILYRDTSSVITGNNLTTLKRIEEQLSQLSEISSIISPFSIKAIRSEEGYMVAERLVGQIPSNRKEEEELISRINSNSYSRDIVFSPDLKTAAITLTLSNKTHETELLNKIDSVIISSGESNKVMKGGLPVIRKFILKDVRRDAIIVVPVALFIMLLILRLTLGSWRNVYIPFSVVILSTGISMGLIPLLGWKLSIITLLIPIILIAVANNYGIYLVSYYNRVANTIKGSKYEILKEVMGSLRIPVLFSGLTTIAGILGLLAHSIIPARQVGVLAACGISIALAMSFFMVPALLSV
ncbi:MAG TPA: MMPL family transporter, partial [Bacteroidales bacterium]|nr:MMPL family transporter [Bacteroidales bacterium]